MKSVYCTLIQTSSIILDWSMYYCITSFHNCNNSILLLLLALSLSSLFNYFLHLAPFPSRSCALNFIIVTMFSAIAVSLLLIYYLFHHPIHHSWLTTCFITVSSSSITPSVERCALLSVLNVSGRPTFSYFISCHIYRPASAYKSFLSLKSYFWQ